MLFEAQARDADGGDPASGAKSDGGASGSTRSTRKRSS
jgi:hypothetical protein